MLYDPETLRRLQLALLEMLHEIDDVCRKHDITYFLSSGSVLGAVRHSGFIPWDDDIDLGMMRPDYDRFCAIAPQALPDDLRLIIPGREKRYSPMFAKVMKRGTKFWAKETMEAGLDLGIFIDIFPYDDLSPDEATAKKQVVACTRWQRISYLYHAPSVVLPHKGVLGAAERLACKAAHGILRLATNEEKNYSKFVEAAFLDSSESDRCTCFSYATLEGYPKSMMVPTVMATFEDGEFPVPGETERYLEMAYGPDWDQLPPPEKRRNHKPEVLEF